MLLIEEKKKKKKRKNEIYFIFNIIYNAPYTVHISSMYIRLYIIIYIQSKKKKKNMV